MIHDLDASFLIAMEVIGHADRDAARDTFAQLVAVGDRFAIAPQVIAEVLHIVTDARRFKRPLDMTEAI